MTTYLPRFGLIAVLLATALFSFAQRSPAIHAEGSTDNVQDIDLARMVLPLSAFGPEYASLKLDPTSGFDPLDERDPSEINAGFVSYVNPASDTTTGPDVVGSGVGLYGDATDAASFLSDSTAQFQAQFEDQGGEYSTFPVLGLNGAVGFGGVFSEPDFGLFYQFTGAIFPMDRLVGVVVFGRSDDTNVNAAVATAVNALADRMKGVLTGKITDFPAPLPPDVNCDGSLDSIDASLVLQLSATLVASLPCDALADANQDGRTNAIDASLILQYSAGLIDSLPVAG